MHSQSNTQILRFAQNDTSKSYGANFRAATLIQRFAGLAKLPQTKSPLDESGLCSFRYRYRLYFGHLGIRIGCLLLLRAGILYGLVAGGAKL